MSLLRLPVLACLLSTLAVQACATAVRGPNVDFVVATEPAGARVTTDLQTPDSIRLQRQLEREARGDSHAQLRVMGQPDLPSRREPVDLGDAFEPEFHTCPATPCRFELSRRAEFTVTVELEGYHTAHIPVTSGFGRQGGSQAAAGTGVSATGAYVVVYSSVTMVETIVGAFFGGSAISSSAASTATVAAASTGLVFLLVDVASGAMLDLRPNPLILVLVPEDQPLPTGEDAVIDTDEALEALLGPQDGEAE